VIVNRVGDISIQFGIDPQEMCKNLDRVDFHEILSFGAETPDCTPENNPLPYAQAYAIAKQALYDVAGLDLDEQAVVTDNQVMSRVYKYKTVDWQRVWLDPVSEIGYYILNGKRSFHGITAECCNNYRYTSLSLPAGDFVVTVAGADSCRVTIGPLRETGVLYDDVPIVSFETAQKAFEEQIERGLLRDVLAVKLCYAPYRDPADENAFYMLPVWFAECVCANTAEYEFEPMTDPLTEEVYEDTRQFGEEVAEGQSGALMDWSATGRRLHEVPDIITWEDIE